MMKPIAMALAAFAAITANSSIGYGNLGRSEHPRGVAHALPSHSVTSGWITRLTVGAVAVVCVASPLRAQPSIVDQPPEAVAEATIFVPVETGFEVHPGILEWSTAITPQYGLVLVGGFQSESLGLLGLTGVAIEDDHLLIFFAGESLNAVWPPNSLLLVGLSDGLGVVLPEQLPSPPLRSEVRSLEAGNLSELAFLDDVTGLRLSVHSGLPSRAVEIDLPLDETAREYLRDVGETLLLVAGDTTTLLDDPDADVILTLPHPTQNVGEGDGPQLSEGDVSWTIDNDGPSPRVIALVTIPSKDAEMEIVFERSQEPDFAFAIQSTARFDGPFGFSINVMQTKLFAQDGGLELTGDWDRDDPTYAVQLPASSVAFRSLAHSANWVGATVITTDGRGTLAFRITDEGRAAFEEAFAAWGLIEADATAPDE